MPLLGSYGGSSEYAYRGTLDDFPDDFSFTDLTDLDPGGIYNTETVTITGINNKTTVSVSAGSSISVNGGEFVATSEESPIFLRNNDTIAISIPTTSGSTLDFNKVYSSEVRVGRKTALWTISTKTIDQTPEPFSFTDLVDREVGIAFTSNEIVLSGLEPGFSFPISIVSGNGQISINGGSLVASGIGSNGDRVYLRLNSPFEFSNNPSGSGTRTNETSVQVGTFTTSWAVSSRDVDVFIEPFNFIDLDNVQPSSIFTAQAVNSLGVVTSVTGADDGIPLVAVASGCEFLVQRPDGFIRRDFSSDGALVFNGDRITARIQSAPGFSETRVGIVTVSSERGEFIVTTRPRPIDTIPDPFTFTDLTGVQRNILVESNEITLSGMTTSVTDEGTASITTGGTGGDAQFQVTRNGSIVRSYGNSTFKVRNGDKIKLRIRSSNENNGTVSATFRVDGVDTSFVLSGQTAFRDDVWTVNSVSRVCDVTPFTIAPLTNLDPNTSYTATFVAGGFESDCGMQVTTSSPFSRVSAGGQTGQSISVSPGTTVTVSFTSGSFSETRSTTITVSNASSGIQPPKTYTTDWSITTRQDNTPASVTLSANPSSIQLGSSTQLTWTSVNSASVVSANGFTANGVTGSATVTPTQTTTYSITLQPNPSASNFPTNVSSSVTVTVQEDTTPNNFSLSPSSYSNQNQNSQVSFTLSPSTVSGLSDGITVSASVSANTSVSLVVNGVNRGSSFNVRNGDSISVLLTNGSSQNFTASGTLTIGTSSANFSSTTTACTVSTGQVDLSNGVIVSGKGARITYQNGTTETLTGNNSLYTSSSGFSLFNTAKAGAAGETFSTVLSGDQTFPIPTSANITQARAFAVGGGGNGSNPSASFRRAGGGGAIAEATFPVSPGGVIISRIGDAPPFPANPFTNGRGSTVLYAPSPATPIFAATVVVSAGGGNAGGVPPLQPGGGPGAGGQFITGQSGSAGGSGFTAGGGAGTFTGVPSPPGGNRPSNSQGVGGGGGGGVCFDAAGNLFTRPGQCGGIQGFGQAGTTFGGGGGLTGNSGGAAGGRGTAGTGFLTWSGTASPATAWNTLIDTIVSAFRNNASRPPKLSEIQTFSSSFINDSGKTLNQLTTDIINSLSSSNRASSFTDECGNTF